jgi:hypothetical protein
MVANRRRAILTTICAVPLLASVSAAGSAPAAAPPPGAPAVAAAAAAAAAVSAANAAVNPPDPRVESTDAALRVLSLHVRHASDPDGLRNAFRAYFNYRHENPERVRKPYLYYVDMGLDNRTPRGYVFDMDRLVLVDGPFHVSHGRGSLNGRDGVPARFSNVPGSFQTSLGLFLAEETYTFRGNASGGAYSSIGLRLRGESGEFNDAARRRGIVAHGAPYVSARDAGRSEGCPAMEQERARRLLPMLADGGVVIIYSPRDLRWLANDPWLNAS